MQTETIYYAEYEPTHGIHAIVNANGLFLTIDYLKKEMTSGCKTNKRSMEKSAISQYFKRIMVKQSIIYQSHIKDNPFRVVQVDQ